MTRPMGARAGTAGRGHVHTGPGLLRRGGSCAQLAESGAERGGAGRGAGMRGGGTLLASAREDWAPGAAGPGPGDLPLTLEAAGILPGLSEEETAGERCPEAGAAGSRARSWREAGSLSSKYLLGAGSWLLTYLLVHLFIFIHSTFMEHQPCAWYTGRLGNRSQGDKQDLGQPHGALILLRAEAAGSLPPLGFV